MESINVVIEDIERDAIATDEDEVIITPSFVFGPDVSNDVPDTSNANEDYDSRSNDDEGVVNTPIKKLFSGIKNNHPTNFIIGNPNEGVTTPRKDPKNYLEMIGNVHLTSKIEPENVIEALHDEYWVNTMQEELV